MRWSSSAGSVLASHNPPDMPRIAIVPRNTHAAGQCRVPAGTNNSAPIATIQIRFCSSSFAIMPCFRLSCGHHDRAVFGNLAALVCSPPLVVIPAKAGYPVITAVGGNFESSGILDCPLSRTMTAWRAISRGRRALRPADQYAFPGPGAGRPELSAEACAKRRHHCRFSRSALWAGLLPGRTSEATP